ncbi:MAG TPA: ABC transporter permease [Anaerolineales bacterium]|nr:ABC transporter permease [Anaerolineales bacterium]HRQ92381.1 ABC transporter permease [Anaerolineales bacterium]
MQGIIKGFQQLLKYPSALVGLTLIALLLITSILTVIFIPREEAVRLWRGGEAVWGQNPKTVPPAWTNMFRSNKLPETIILTQSDPTAEIEATPRQEGENRIILYSFDYTADAAPQDVVFNFTSTYTARNPFVSIFWITPDGREIRLVEQGINYNFTYRVIQDDKLRRRLGGISPEAGLFDNPETEALDILKGEYQIVIDTLTFEDESTISKADVVLHGKVYGLFGTDNQRRDLTIGILWGVPIALAFGLVASFGTSIAGIIFAAISVWYGGWVDELIQRITEINLNLPVLSILIMIGTFYSKSIVVILGATVLLSIFSGAIKSYRAIFMQVKESPYIEAARSYGASSSRVIFSYMIPRVTPLLIPGLVLGVPNFVFLEATLASLNLGDPVLPTWGKIIYEAWQTGGAVYNGYYYWILEPAILLIITGLGFAMVGFAMDRIFNPRLRDI